MPDFNTQGECIDITVGASCSVDCRYWCPSVPKFTANYDGPPLLSKGDFWRALENTPMRVNIVFAGFVEPFLNPYTVEMIEIAKAQGRKVSLYSTLQGLRAEDVPRLKGKLDYFCLHLPDNKGIAHVFDTPNYQKTLSAVFHQLNIDEYSRMDTEFNGQDRAGNLERRTKERKVRGPFYCRRLTHPQPIMLPNLDLQLCSQDWSLQHKLGNLGEQTYDAIIDGEMFTAIRAARYHMGGEELCRSCSNAWSPPKAVAIELGVEYQKRVFKWARKKSGI